MKIDTSFDFRRDAGGRDPDAYSATLRSYHRHLVRWRKSCLEVQQTDVAHRKPVKFNPTIETIDQINRDAI
ncbi:DUF6994 family protein [Parasphingorhabdus sp.]|uniref:DUF6994 family protein n=1 Tax=Parasphingorhabdus sp. TaxID=2709688 RepID=UPI003FA6FA80